MYTSTEGGFNRGYLLVQGLGSFAGAAVKVLFQNENLIIQQHRNDNSTGEILVTTPDLITGTYIPYRAVEYVHKFHKLIAIRENFTLEISIKSIFITKCS